MQTQRINIILPNDLARDFRRSIPVRSRSKFIAKILKEKLPKKNSKQALIKNLKINKEFYKKVAEQWKATEIEEWPD